MGTALLATRRHVLAQMVGVLAFTGLARAAGPEGAVGTAPPPKTSPLSPAAAAKLNTLQGKAVLGAPGTPPLVTELVDYNAPDWRRSAEDMRELLASDARLSYAIVQAPRADVGSLEAARVALVVLAKARARFEEFYLALAATKGPVDGLVALDAARHLDLDRFVLFNASIQPENTEALTNAAAFASAAGVLDTPAYVIGNMVFEGYMDLDRKRALIAAARS